METGWLWIIPAAPLAGFVLDAVLALASSRPGGKAPRAAVSLIACLGPAAAFVVSLAAFLQLRGLPEESRRLTQTLYGWISSGSFDVHVGFVVDALTAVMLLFVTGVGTLIHVYSVGYMHAERGFARYFAYLNLFMFAMLVLVLADSLPVLFVGWEGVGLCSYLLIGYWYEDPEKAAAGKKAFVVNRIGDFGVLLAMFLIFWSLQRAGAPSLAIADLRAHLDAVSPALATAICLLLFLGAAGKSAQIPLYVWLPDAMAGPTPVSALIHAATMVTAGVYLVARLGFLYALSPLALSIVALVGAVTAVFAATIALAQNDFKKVLAYSTISQLGYMFVGVGVGAYASGIFHVFTHSFFKACLFLGSGAVIHALHGEQDVRRMGGLRRLMPITFWTFLASTLALAGMPPLAGFFSKDEILWQALSRPNAVWPWLPHLLWVLLVAGAFLTAFYMWRLLSLVFFGQHRGSQERFAHAHEAPPSMAVPLVLLALGSVVVGFAGRPHFLGGSDAFGRWLEPAVGASLVAVPAETGSGAAEWAAMLVAFAAGLAGLVLGDHLYRRRPAVAEAWSRRFAGLQRLLSNKYYVDEIYDTLVVRPVAGLAHRVLWRALDVRLIDGVVNLLAGLTKALSYVFRFAQSGYVQTYVLVLVLGVIVLLVKVL